MGGVVLKHFRCFLFIHDGEFVVIIGPSDPKVNPDAHYRLFGYSDFREVLLDGHWLANERRSLAEIRNKKLDLSSSHLISFLRHRQ